MRDLADELRRRTEGRPIWLDDRWERLAAGTLPAEERAELEELAERSEEARRLWELCQPLSSEIRGRIVDRIKGQEPDETRPETEGKAMEPSRRFPGGVWWWAPAAVAAAAVAAVIVLWPGRAAAPLPGYSVELAGGVQVQRSPDLPPPRPVFEAGTRFELTLRPQTRVEGRLEVRGYLAPGDPPDRFDLDPWLAREVPPGRGAVTIDGIVGEDIELRPGEWRLWLVVARPGAMPEIDELEADLSRGVTQGQGWVVATPTRSLQMR